MTPTALIAALAGALIVGGAVTLASALLTSNTRDTAQPRAVTRRWTLGGALGFGPWSPARLAAAAAAGLVVWLAFGWLIIGALTAVTVLGLPLLLATSRDASRRIDRVEAVEAWTRRLADLLATGMGLEQAISVSARTCPPDIAGPVQALVARLDAHWTTEDALYAFADDLDDPTADLMVAGLLLAARRRGPGLARVLGSVADSLAEEVAMRRSVEADRAKPRATARAVTLITLAVVVLGLLNTTYTAPYRTPLGQLVFAAIAVGFIAALAWMRALTLSRPAPRVLRSRSPSAPSTTDPGGPR